MADDTDAALKVLQLHNAYRYRGGEDTVVEAEAQLLRVRGHSVLEFRRDNDELAGTGRLRAAADTLWSQRSRRELRELIGDERPDILHAHNTFPLISPSVFWAAEEFRLPVVQTLHNFRLICPQAMLLREGRICEQCVGRVPVAAVAHACYRGSRAATGVLAGMLVLHRSLGTWQNKVDRYIALNEFCRKKFIEGGLPAGKIVIKPNFAADRDVPPGDREGLLFVGRLSPEKGVQVLADAAATLPEGSVRVIGTGPAADQLAHCGAVHMLGQQPAADVLVQMARSVALVFPSIWYETFGLVIIEAFSVGTPVIASRLGAALDLVVDGHNGLLVEPGDAADLQSKLAWALSHPLEMAEMGRRARQTYLANYTPTANYTQLLDVYQQAQQERQRRN